MSVNGIEINGELTQELEGILTEDALQFIAKLHRKFASTRACLLEKRIARHAEIDAGNMPDFLPETENLRNDSSWQVSPIPDDLQNRRIRNHEELEKIKSRVGDERYSSGKYELASQLFDQFATEEKFTDFLTLVAYNHL